MLGYQVLQPGRGRLLNGLRWDPGVDPVTWQPGSTIFERAVAQGITAFRIAPGSFRGSALSIASMRGADYRSADSLGALVAETAERAAGDPPTAWLPSTTGRWTATGHAHGSTSAGLAVSSSAMWTSWPSSWSRRCRRTPWCTSRRTTAWSTSSRRTTSTWTTAQACATGSR
jgi:hypothetical protein